MERDEQNVIAEPTTNEATTEQNLAPEAGVENVSEPAAVEAPAIAEVAGDAQPTEAIGEAPATELNREGQEL